ncbi:response regulator [Paenibacillus guangzhouensis]|uniref:response regulator n=1 Tax=Paenibacillus guangzhouensis TaxID=1473112 RepID=UPI00126727C9|nr:response regulator [Paenibacillus guangzhouensis]
MYNVLIVDDEPLICKGLSGLLASTGLPIQSIYTAHSGHEALDYLRMEEIHLLITDIQMGAMSGIELMHQAKMLNPAIEAIIISAHETFQYAQQAIRLGAKDYLVKPLNENLLLDSVRDALLKSSHRRPSLDETFSLLADSDHFHMEEPLQDRMSLLAELIKEPSTFIEPLAQTLQLEELKLRGPYFAILTIRLDLSKRKAEREVTPADLGLLHYASLNMIEELMRDDWQHIAFYTEQEIHVIVQWDEEAYQDTGIPKIHHLEMLGRTIHASILKYLGLSCVVGISQILRGVSFLGVLSEQAHKAISWNQQHRDHYVFYYGNFHWSQYDREEPTEDELHQQNNSIVEQAKAFIDGNYAQKGLTLHEVAQKNHVSPNYLSYLYKKFTGYNLWEYVIKLRMEESKRLLLQTDLRRYEISERVGYESPEHFSKIFKKYYGMSPSEVKK